MSSEEVNEVNEGAPVDPQPHVLGIGETVTVAAYQQDPDSYGWSAIALFCVRFAGMTERWGTMNCLLTTSVGADALEEPIARARTQVEAILVAWHLVDWHPSERAARGAYREIESRRW